MMKRKFFNAWLNKCRKMSTKVLPSAISYDQCCQWSLWPCLHEEKPIPKDVPKGHLVVYVGEDYNYKRFVIKVTLLEHPVFKALLDLAQEEYEFTPDSKLCIPCDENVFLSIVRCANVAQNPRIWFCL